MRLVAIVLLLAVTSGPAFARGGAGFSPHAGAAVIVGATVASRSIASRPIATRSITSRAIASRAIASRAITSRAIASRAIASRRIASRSVAVAPRSFRFRDEGRRFGTRGLGAIGIGGTTETLLLPESPAPAASLPPEPFGAAPTALVELPSGEVIAVSRATVNTGDRPVIASAPGSATILTGRGDGLLVEADGSSVLVVNGALIRRSPGAVVITEAGAALTRDAAGNPAMVDRASLP